MVNLPLRVYSLAYLDGRNQLVTELLKKLVWKKKKVESQSVNTKGDFSMWYHSELHSIKHSCWMSDH